MKLPESEAASFFRRMSEQEHPEVLPICVEALEAEVNSVANRLNKIEEFHANQRAQSRKNMGLVILSTTVACAQAEAVNVLSQTGINLKPVVVFGAVAVGIFGAFEFGKGHDRRQFSHHLKLEYSQLNEYRMTALNRAINIGVIDPTSELS